MNAGRIGNAQTSAEVARVGDAIEHEQKSRFFQGIEHIVEMRDLAATFDAGNDALMFRSRRHAIQPLAIAGNDFDALQFGMLEQVAHAPILAGGINHKFLDRFGIVAQFGSHGMEAVNQAGSHGSFLKMGRRILARRAAPPKAGN
ncbi:MAG: hypothetical protein ACD_10C00849G0001 [uncultured bacterium]|nr:MAG: hypothetical protein ACD_10C00849G0001 [uncultured bacterium]